MNRIRDTKGTVSIFWLGGIIAAAGLVQYALFKGYPATGFLTFLLFGFIFVGRSQIVDIQDIPAPYTYADFILPLGLWGCAFALRIYHVDSFYIINDLSARFLLSTLRILQGDVVFPCMKPFEYDESLISWVFAPFIKLFGHDWLTVKIISAALNTMLVPVAWFWLRDRFSRWTTLLAVGLLVTSGYFQYCDPMISMSRFSFIAMAFMVLPGVLERALSSKPSPFSIPMTIIIMVLSMYLHSTGRAVLVVVLGYGLYKIYLGKNVSRTRLILRLTTIFWGVFICFLPFLVFIHQNQTYMFFKGRQVFGLHENYPFSWMGLWDNFVSVFGNFNYRAYHHMHFPDRFPLLRPLTATGVIGFLWMIPGNYKRRDIVYWSLVVLATVLPLSIVTPGHWRGLYFSVPVAFLTTGAGIFYASIIQKLAAKLLKFHGKTIVFNVSSGVLTGCILLGIATYRIPTYYSGVFAPQRTDLITKLYKDMEDEPDVPHYFSVTIPEMKQDYAIFELLGTAWFTEFAVLEFSPLRTMFEPHHGRVLRPDTLNAPQVRLVVRSDDADKLRDIKTLFGSLQISQLSHSGLIVLTINGDRQ